MKQLNIGKAAISVVIASGGIATEGLRIETDLAVKHLTETIMREKQESTKRKNHDYYRKVKVFRAAQKALDLALKNAITLAQVTRDNLKPKLGSQYSVAWNAVGFVNATLRMPRTLEKAMALLSAMELFLKGNPEFVLPGAVTPELAADASNNLRMARMARAQANVAMRQQKKVRDEAVADLRHALMMLRRELSMLLEDNDPRWLSFGFKVPSDASVPQAPEGLKVVQELPGQAMLSWGKTANTDRFHVFQETVGVDAAPVRVATVSGTSKTITSLPPGAQVQFFVRAVNVAGESLPSDVVKLIVPLVDGVENSEAIGDGNG